MPCKLTVYEMLEANEEIAAELGVAHDERLHLALGSLQGEAFCGIDACVPTLIPVSAWGNKDRKWCPKCTVIAKSLGHNVGKPCMICGNWHRIQDDRGVCKECNTERPPKKMR